MRFAEIFHYESNSICVSGLDEDDIHNCFLVAEYVRLTGEFCGKLMMKEIIAYKMSFNKMWKYQDDITCVPFQEKYWNEYMKIYNECFYEMRKALEIEPINFYSDYSQIRDKISNTFLYLQNGIIAGAVSSYGNELDDLIVEKSFQGQGLGQRLLLWGMNHIKEQGYEEIILHVAEWNQKAVKLYLKNGFTIRKKGKTGGDMKYGISDDSHGNCI